MELPEYWHVNAKHKDFDFEKFKKVMIENQIKWADGYHFSDAPLDEGIYHYVFKDGFLKYNPDEFTKVSAFSVDITSRFLNTTDLNGWIRVKDRLPEKSGFYIVFMGDVNCDFFHSHKNDFHHYSDSVTHWQPLPSQPSKE